MNVRSVFVAQVIKENSTLQEQAKKEWILLGVIWLVTLLSFKIPSLFKGSIYASIVPLITVVIAGKLSWRTLIIIRGNKGEKQVFNTLLELSDSYRVLNDVTIKVNGKEAQIDHLLVSPHGLWSIETKSHLGRIFGKENDKNWTQKKKSEKGRIYSTKIINPIAQNKVHCKRLQEYLKNIVGLSVSINSIVVFTSAEQLNVESITPVVTTKKLKKTIESFDKNCVLSEKQILTIIKAVL